MQGMNRNTGTALSGVDHVRQSIIDILTTPVGSRVMRRDYGSRLYQWLDAPANRSTLVEIYAAVAEALLKWEPRFQLERVQVDAIAVGRISLWIDGEYRPTQQMIRLDGLEI